MTTDQLADLLRTATYDALLDRRDALMLELATTERPEVRRRVRRDMARVAARLKAMRSEDGPGGGDRE